MPTEIVAETLRERLRSTTWWSLGLVATIAFTVAFYPAVRDDASLGDFAEDLPESLRALFVGGELDLVSPAGYLNSQIFALVAPALLLVFSIGHGSGAVAGEEERGTLDLVLAHPVRRRDYVLQRFAAMTSLVAVLTAVVFATVALGAVPVDLEIGLDKLAAASVSVGLLALLFGTLALSVGAVRAGRAAALAVATAVAIASWLLDGLAQAVGVLEPLRPLSPYYQALGTNPLREGPPWQGWAILVGATAVLVAVAAAGLERRDARQ